MKVLAVLPSLNIDVFTYSGIPHRRKPPMKSFYHFYRLKVVDVWQKVNFHFVKRQLRSFVERLRNFVKTFNK